MSQRGAPSLPAIRRPETAPAARSCVPRAEAEAVARYFSSRRSEVPSFIDRHFSLAGTLRLHRAALGFDLLRAPANLLLAGPQIGVRMAAALLHRCGARRSAARLRRVRLLQTTAVARSLRRSLLTELLVPCSQVSHRGGNVAPSICACLISIDTPPPLGASAALSAPCRRVEAATALDEYLATRVAAAEITTGLLTLAAGALLLERLTPGVITLGPALAGMLARDRAIAAFPFGRELGTIWYGWFPVTPHPALLYGLTAGLMLAASGIAAFSGIITDPLQRRLGLHRRRLLRLLDALERQVRNPDQSGFTARDHYLPRLLDLLDVCGTLWRMLIR